MMVIEKGEVKCKILFYMGLHKRLCDVSFTTFLEG